MPRISCTPIFEPEEQSSLLYVHDWNGGECQRCGRGRYCGGYTGVLAALVVGVLVVGVLAGALVLGLT